MKTWPQAQGFWDRDAAPPHPEFDVKGGRKDLDGFGVKRFKTRLPHDEELQMLQ